MSKNKWILFFSAILFLCTAYADDLDEIFVTVTFSSSKLSISNASSPQDASNYGSVQWTNNPSELESTNSSTVNTGSNTQWESASGNSGEFTSASEQQAWLDSVYGSGNYTITSHGGYNDTVEVTIGGTKTTTTQTTTVVKTAKEVDIFFTLWDIVDDKDTSTMDTETDTVDSAWFQSWERSSAKELKGSTFQIRKDTEAVVGEKVTNLNRLYGDLFDVQEQISRLLTDLEAYRSNPNLDKEHTSLMGKLAKLRKEEFDLKREIVKNRKDILATTGDQEKGWIVDTTTTVTPGSFTEDVTTQTTITTNHNYCFVATTKFADGISIEDAWKKFQSYPILENGKPQVGKLVRSGHYKGPVYMFYDENDKALLPGAITLNHPIVTADNLKSKRADEIQKGDKIVCASNRIATVNKIEVTQYNGYLYNIANGCLPFTFVDKDYAITLGIDKVEGNVIEKDYDFTK